MKKIFVLASIVFSINAYSQQLSQISFANASTFTYFSFLTDQGTLLRLSDTGELLEWGTEVQSTRSSEYFDPKLRPYMGRVEYYGKEVDSAFRGKIKMIGTCAFTYYTSMEVDDLPGKIKTIGRTTLAYFTRFDNPFQKGKLKTIGSIALDYYNQFEDEGSKGKLKTVGPTKIVYHSKFDDKYVQGKIKSIGSVTYNWGTSLDAKGYGGVLKSGSYRQNVNGIVYVLR